MDSDTNWYSPFRTYDRETSAVLLLGGPIAPVLGSTTTESLYFSLPVLKEKSNGSTP